LFLPDGQHFFYTATHEANTDHNTTHGRSLVAGGRIWRPRFRYNNREWQTALRWQSSI
jgi:hypothetical protein